MDKEEGIIYEESCDTACLERPFEVIVGKKERRVPISLQTRDLDMIDGALGGNDPRIKMSCGHAISKFCIF